MAGELLQLKHTYVAHIAPRWHTCTCKAAGTPSELGATELGAALVHCYPFRGLHTWGCCMI